MKDDYVNQCYVYAVTVWGTIDLQPDLDKFYQRIAKKYVYQLEQCPSTNTYHFQCYISLRKKEYCGKVKKLFNTAGFTGADVKVASSIGKESLKDYCMKKESRVEGPWADKPIYLGRDLIKQLRPWQQSVVELIEKEPHKRKIHWFYDLSGGKGKSSLSKYLYFHYKILTLTIGKASDLLNLVYKLQGKRMYILDISRTVPAGVMNELYMAIESVKNGYFVNTKYDTGVACFEIPHVVVMSNHLPKMKALSRDRWNIIDMSQVSQEKLILD